MPAPGAQGWRVTCITLGMMRRSPTQAAALIGLCCGLSCAAAPSAPPPAAPTAGATPTGSAAVQIAAEQRNRRPAHAPRLTTFPVSEALRWQRLRGVETPLPGNLAAIAAQGAWYSPMFSPGMTGPYDLRAWHPESQ